MQPNSPDIGRYSAGGEEMTYILHMDFGWWQEEQNYCDKAYLIKFLRSGFVPKGCKLIVEHEGEFHEWNREADYAKPYRYTGMGGKEQEAP